MPPKDNTFGGIAFYEKDYLFNEQGEGYSIKGYATLLTKSLH